MSLRELLRDHESVEWDEVFDFEDQPVSGTELKLVGRYSDIIGLDDDTRRALFETTIARRGFWADVSIAGRTAYCAAILERARDAWGLPQLTPFIDALWTFTSSENIMESQEALAQHRVKRADDVAYANHHAPALFVLLGAAWDVATTDIGGEVEEDSPGTRVGVTVAEWQAQRADLDPPNPDRFARSAFSEYGGWGDRKPRDFFVA
jgi:hypothetical protein